MKRYGRAQIENAVLRLKKADFTAYTDDALAQQIALVRRMKASLDKEKETVRKSLKVVK